MVSLDIIKLIFKHGIRVDPLKVEAILNLPPSTLRQLQSLQGKANILPCFIPNYAELTKGFTQLLKKGYEFVWDDTTNKAIEALKLALTRTPLLYPKTTVISDYAEPLLFSIATLCKISLRDNLWFSPN